MSGMSHLDELDEFEAELEISLKREYSAVFGLFRYCVLTQDALDRLQLAMLGEGPSKGHLALLKGALSEQRDATGDIGLDDTLNWAEVRVAVEAAKLEREAEPA